VPKSPLRQWTVDAFAARPFTGNPAAVVAPFDAWPDDAWMQALAEENNHAETAYLLKTADPARFGLRWFTPAMEVPLCGHATLAAAHVLFAELELDATAVAFETRQAGVLAVERAGEGYRMDFPAAASTPIETPPGLAEALGAAPVQVFSSRYLMAVMADEATVRGLSPYIAAIKPIGEADGQRGNLIVCAKADAGRPYQVVSRFFAPGSGIPEDPATGSAHCILAPVWAAKLGRLKLDFHQAYPGRGADVTCEVAGERVRIGGRAVTVMDARLRL
jgi:PhzF family phenazine biosynthesis protein